MHGVLKQSTRMVLMPGVLALALAPAGARGDDTGFLGRLFRLGGNSSTPPSSGGSGRSAGSAERTAPLPYGSRDNARGSFDPPATAPRSSGPGPSGSSFGDGPSTPEIPGDLSSQPRVSPRPRASSAVTTADPLLTRLALGRSNDGSQFGMFLQLFADGTVIDSDGVHRLSAADLRPIAELIQGGELARVRGHCSAPSADFVEHVHVVVFERRMGRLQAHSLSYSGTPQGCEPAIRQLHTVLESIQAKLSRQSTAAGNLGTASAGPTLPNAGSPPVLTPPVTGVGTVGAPGAGHHGSPPLPDPGAANPAATGRGAIIPLTPFEPR